MYYQIVTDRNLSGFERYKDPLKENVVGISFHFKEEIFIIWLFLPTTISHYVHTLKFKMKLGILILLNQMHI